MTMTMTPICCVTVEAQLNMSPLCKTDAYVRMHGRVRGGLEASTASYVALNTAFNFLDSLSRQLQTN